MYESDVMEDSKEMLSSRCNRMDTQDSDNIHKTRTGSNEKKNPCSEKEKWGKVLPLTQKVFVTDTSWKKENKFASR